MIKPVRVASRGWRAAWRLRLSLLLVAVVAIPYYLFLFGLPWQSEPSVVMLLVLMAAVIVIDLLVVECTQVRLVRIERDEVVFGYLLSEDRVPASRLTRTSMKGPFGSTEVAFEDAGAGGLLGRRYRWVTRDQAAALSGEYGPHPRADS